MKKLITVLFILFSLVGFVKGDVAEGESVLAFQDTYVDGFKATTNYGSDEILAIGPGESRVAYFGFDLTDYVIPSGRVVSLARLRLTAAGFVDVNELVVYEISDNTWDANIITSEFQPGYSGYTPVFRVSSPTYQTYLDLTSVVRSKLGQQFSLVITSGPSEYDYGPSFWASLENSDPNARPTLEIFTDNPDPDSCGELWEYGLGKPADINRDCQIDFVDLSVFVEQWMQTNNPAL
jgi:hypothetical protein